jgi:hypothetical protein
MLYSNNFIKQKIKIKKGKWPVIELFLKLGNTFITMKKHRRHYCNNEIHTYCTVL